MSAFDPDAWRRHQLDYSLLAESSVRLFWRRAVLDEAAGWLRRHAYQVVELDAADWRNDTDMHNAFAAALGFPRHYGRNLDALNDCLSEVAGYEYGSSRSATGLVLVIRRYDAFAAARPDTAAAVLDIVATTARAGLLIGHRILCLVQSDDPDITFPTVGATPVSWNDEERLTATRR